MVSMRFTQNVWDSELYTATTGLAGTKLPVYQIIGTPRLNPSTRASSDRGSKPIQRSGMGLEQEPGTTITCLWSFGIPLRGSDMLRHPNPSPALHA